MMCVMAILKPPSFVFSNATVIEDGRLGPGFARIKCVDRRNNDDEDEREAEAGNKQGFKAISFSKNTDNKLKQKN